MNITGVRETSGSTNSVQVTVMVHQRLSIQGRWYGTGSYHFTHSIVLVRQIAHIQLIAAPEPEWRTGPTVDLNHH